MLVCSDATWRCRQRFPYGPRRRPTRRSSAPIDWQLPFSCPLLRRAPISLGFAGASRRNGYSACCSWLGARAVPSQAASGAERASLTGDAARDPFGRDLDPNGHGRGRGHWPGECTGSSWHPVRPTSPGSGAGPTQQLGHQLLGLRVGINIQVGQPAGQQPVGTPDRIRPARAGPVGASAAGTAPRRPGQR